jgi:hypothetical protein
MARLQLSKGWLYTLQNAFLDEHHPSPSGQMHIPALDVTSYFSFLSGTMITLFVITLVIIFVYEYEVLRRPKS